MRTGLAVVGFVVVALVVGTCVACTDEDDTSLGRVELVSHDYDDGGGDQDYDQWRNEDRNRNRNRNRGAFSPGPFDDSPVDAFNNACMPGATCHYGDSGQQEDAPPDERDPQ